MPSLPSDLTSLEPILFAFKNQRHSLRISVSNLAALVGFHPYKQVPELILQLVYQGSVGQVLLQNDAELLGLSLLTPQEQLQQIARKAGASTEQALAQALTKTSDSVEAARVIKETVVREAAKTGKLQTAELKVLQEGVRSAVDTMHGTRHEDTALDAYEQQIGWQVRERNAQIKSWAFRTSCNGGETQTVEPIGEATCFYRTKQDASDGTKPADEGSAEEGNCEDTADKDPKRPKIIDLTDDDEPDVTTAELVTKEPTIDEPPFLCLLGSIDGIRDELAPNAATDDDDASWVLQTIVVECKHRMNRIHKTPPLYEQIQTVAYCFMYGAEHADIVQVMRRDQSSLPKSTRDKTPVKSNKAAQDEVYPTKSPRDNKQKLLTDCFPKEKQVSEENKAEATDIVIPLSTDTTTTVLHCEVHVDACTDVESADIPVLECKEILVEDRKYIQQPAPLHIAVSRVSLDDPIYQHRTQWKEALLPRLRSVVDAIYNIRSDDHKRYQLLSSLATQDGSVSTASWQLIFLECPWMEHSNTAYSWNTRPQP